MSNLVRNLIMAVVALCSLSLLARVLFDTPWWGIVVGFSLAVVWVTIYSVAVARGIPLAPDAFRRGNNANPALASYAPPIWVALVLLWFGAGWFITNGGG